MMFDDFILMFDVFPAKTLARQGEPMRTTLTIDDDILAAAKSLAARRHTTIGEVISELARQSLRPITTGTAERNGVPLLPLGANTGPVTLDVVNALRDEAP
jgi:hypothetical protein